MAATSADSSDEFSRPRANRIPQIFVFLTQLEEFIGKIQRRQQKHTLYRHWTIALGHIFNLIIDILSDGLNVLNIIFRPNLEFPTHQFHLMHMHIRSSYNAYRQCDPSEDRRQKKI